MIKFAPITLVLIAPILAACSPGAAPDDAAELPPPVIEGVWRATQVRHEAGPDAGSHSLDVQPSVYIFSGGHYGIAAVDGFAARSFLSTDATAAETGRAYAPFTGHAGTYTSQSQQLRLSPQVSKDPAQMESGAVLDYELSWVEGDAWLTRNTPEAGRVMTRLTPVTDQDVQLSAAQQRMQGAWHRVEKIVDRGPEAGRHLEDIQPGYYIFMGDKFVGNFVTAFSPRPIPPAEATDEELGASFGPYTSFGGRFDINADGVLVFWPAVTLNPNNMRGRPFQSIQMEWEGDDVWFVYTSTDGAENRTRLTKVSG